MSRCTNVDIVVMLDCANLPLQNAEEINERLKSFISTLKVIESKIRIAKKC